MLSVTKKGHDEADTQCTRERYIPSTWEGYSPRETCCYMFWKCLIGSAAYRERRKRDRCYSSVNSVSQIDRVSRVVFPVSFLLFNVLYWVLYLRSVETRLNYQASFSVLK